MDISSSIANRIDLEDYITEALKELSRSAPIAEVCKVVCDKHGKELKGSGDIFYTWQYDIRWVAHRLRKRHILKQADRVPRGFWELESLFLKTKK